MFTYDKAVAFVVERLARDVERHRAGEYSKIGEGFDELDANLPRSAGPEFDKLHVALNFWDSWQDARNHEWEYYPGIGQGDWPRLAKSIVEDLSAGRDILDSQIVEKFGLSK